MYISSAKQCCDVGILDNNLLRDTMQFYSTVCEFLLYQMESRQIDGPFIAKILPTNMLPSNEFSAIPEWYIEDIADFILFCMQYVLDVVVDCMDQSIITLILTCVCAPKIIKNPYVVAKFVEVLFITSPTLQTQTSKLYYSVSNSLFKWNFAFFNMILCLCL